MSKATNITCLIVERLRALNLLHAVYRGRDADHLPENVQYPSALVRSGTDTLAEEAGKLHRWQRSVVIELVSDAEDPEPVLDDLLVAVRGALPLREPRCLNGLAVGLTYGGAEYAWPESGSAITSLIINLQFHYRE